MKLEHIGIAVKDVKSANELFKKLLGKEHYKIENVENEKVVTSFFETGASKLELLESGNNGSAIHKFIEKKGEGIHHMAFSVDDIYKEIKRLKSEGFEIINEQPHKGADNKWVCFIHPRSCNGVLVELCQEIK